MMIPLYKPHIPPKMEKIVADVFYSGQIAVGYNVETFENLLRDYLGNPWVAVNGDVSTALTLCLFQAGVRPGDDVLMSPLVCLATSCPARNLFANIRWCDVDPLTGNIDPESIEKNITSRTKAIVVYHWAGNPADLDAIQSVAGEHGLVVIEDAGEALGAKYKGKKIGSTGSDYTVFSFYPNRHLAAIDGGAIALSCEENYEKIRRLIRYGIHQPSFRCEDGEINPSSDIPVAGWNSYMSHISATIGVAQMDQLDWIIARHQENGLYYDERFASIPEITVLKRHPDSISAYWVYTFLALKRDNLLMKLRKEGIYCSKVHLRNDIYTCFGIDRQVMPGVDHFSEHCLSIPCGWWVREKDRKKIADLVCHES